MITVDDILPLVITEPNSGCWIWAGDWTVHGYGVHKVDKRNVPAYRWVYQALRGPVEGGLHLDHLCMVKCCCNPDHLEPVTKEENFRRKREKGLSARTINVVDCERESRDSAARQIERIRMELYGLSGQVRRLEPGVASRLTRLLMQVDIERLAQQALLDEYTERFRPLDEFEPITASDAQALLSAVMRLSNRRAA